MHDKVHEDGQWYVDFCQFDWNRSSKLSDEYEEIKAARNLRNVFIKGFPEDWNENHLIEIFSKYGTIISHYLMESEPYEYDDDTDRYNEKGQLRARWPEKKINNFERHKMRAFICYETEEEATNAINGEKRKEYNGHKLFVTNCKNREFIRWRIYYRRRKMQKIKSEKNRALNEELKKQEKTE